MPHPRSLRRAACRRAARRVRHASAPRPAPPVDRKALAARLIGLLSQTLEGLEARNAARAEAARLREALARLERR